MLPSLRPVRSLAVIAVVIAAAASGGCPLSASSPSNPFESGACEADADCRAVGSTCCECPTFAVSRSEPRYNVCGGVECEPAECTSNVVARCVQQPDGGPGKCELRCAPVACPGSCPDGYATEPNGCLSCACAVPVAGGCAGDTDCTRTRADCCGCARGGVDVAVLTRDRTQFDKDLDCPSSTSCPEVDVCDPAQAPHCIQGKCALVEDELPPGACGRSDLTCPAGTVCTVNVSDPYNLRGLGVCAPA